MPAAAPVAAQGAAAPAGDEPAAVRFYSSNFIDKPIEYSYRRSQRKRQSLMSNLNPLTRLLNQKLSGK